MAAKKKVIDVEVDNSNRVFKSDKQALLTIGVVVLVALVAFNFGNITGNVISDPTSLTVMQDGKVITVEVNYPAGSYGKENNVVYMRTKVGTKSVDETTQCDRDLGYVARGTSKCVREIATFDIRGSTWSPGEVVTFSVKNTDVSRDYAIR